MLLSPSSSVPTWRASITPHSLCVALLFVNRLLKCMCTQTGSGWWPRTDIATCLHARGKAACLSPMWCGDFSLRDVGTSFFFYLRELPSAQTLSSFSGVSDIVACRSKCCIPWPREEDLQNALKNGVQGAPSQMLFMEIEPSSALAVSLWQQRGISDEGWNMTFRQESICLAVCGGTSLRRAYALRCVVAHLSHASPQEPEVGGSQLQGQDVCFPPSTLHRLWVLWQELVTQLLSHR